MHTTKRIALCLVLALLLQMAGLAGMADTAEELDLQQSLEIFVEEAEEAPQTQAEDEGEIPLETFEILEEEPLEEEPAAQDEEIDLEPPTDEVLPPAQDEEQQAQPADAQEDDGANAPGDPNEGAPLISIQDIRASVRANMALQANLAPSELKTDIVFVIDSTGSMSDEINNVINNLNTFTSVLEEGGVSYRVAIIDYKDITESGEETRLLKDSSGNTWFKNPETIASVLSGISVDGGGDGPETLVDALGMMLSGALSFRSGASRFAMVLTDANYKNNNNYGYADMDALIDRLVNVGVCTSVISSTSYKSTYEALYSRTDGIFCNIYNSDFASELIQLAEYMKKIVQPVKIFLTTEELGSTNYRLSASIQSDDEEETIDKMTVRLTLPSGLTTSDSKTRTVSALAPGGECSFTWDVQAPLQDTDATYTWKVSAESDDFAIGVVCSAQDTFTVAGGRVAYTWNTNSDSYGFTNSGANFGRDQYDLTDEDLNAFVYALRGSDQGTNWLNEIGGHYGRGDTQATRLENFLKNDMKPWTGSCYGMSLSAGLFKVGAMLPHDYGASVTHSLSLGRVESMINIYQMSWTINSSYLECAEIGSSDLPGILGTMFTMGENVLTASSQQPFPVYLLDKDGKYTHACHAVLCVGGESGTFNDNGRVYHRRLLIVDPNISSMQYIYISDDASLATFTNGRGYNYFGYLRCSLSQLNNYAHSDTTRNYGTRIYAGEKTNLAINTKEGGNAVIIANQLLKSSGGITVREQWIPEATADGSVTAGNVFFDIMDDSSAYTISPVDNMGYVVSSGNVDATLIMPDYSTTVQGKVGSVIVSPKGNVALNDVTGNVEVTVAINDSTFDFVTIKGAANGSVDLDVNRKNLIIKGDLENYTVTNMNTAAKKKTVKVAVNGDAKVTMSGSNVKVSVDADKDGKSDAVISSDVKQPYSGLYRTTNAEYKVNPKGTATYMRPIKSAKNVNIPATITVNGSKYKVVSIAKNAFKNNKKLTKVKIGKNVGTIGANAFLNCKNLKTVEGGKGITKIKSNAFKSCVKLSKITLHSKVKTVEKGAFNLCKRLSKITISRKTIKAGKNAFTGIAKKAVFYCPKSNAKAMKKLLVKAGAPNSIKVQVSKDELRLI